MLEQLEIKEFSKHTNSKFKIHFYENLVIEAELIEVLDLKKAENLMSFSLVFLLPANSPIEQRTFRVEHSEMGWIDLFLVPIGQNEKGIRYEAIFNRIIEV
jgi:hypothetical protein